MVRQHSIAHRLASCAMVGASLLALTVASLAQAPQIPPAITTPDKVESRIAMLDFEDGAPSAESVSKIYDKLDFTPNSAKLRHRRQPHSTRPVRRKRD